MKSDQFEREDHLKRGTPVDPAAYRAKLSDSGLWHFLSAFRYDGRPSKASYLAASVEGTQRAIYARANMRSKLSCVSGRITEDDFFKNHTERSSMYESIKAKTVRKPTRKRTQRQTAPAFTKTELVTRLAMLGVSLGSLAQMLGYNEIGHTLLTVGGLCGASAHTGGNPR